MSQLVPGEFLQQFLRVIAKVGRTSSHLLVGHYEERPIISQYNLSVEDATELALDRPLWMLVAARVSMH